MALNLAHYPGKGLTEVGWEFLGPGGEKGVA